MDFPCFPILTNYRIQLKFHLIDDILRNIDTKRVENKSQVALTLILVQHVMLPKSGKLLIQSLRVPQKLCPSLASISLICKDFPYTDHQVSSRFSFSPSYSYFRIVKTIRSRHFGQPLSLKLVDDGFALLLIPII